MFPPPGLPPHPWLQAVQPIQPELASLSNSPAALQNDLKSLRETLDLLKAVQRELDMLHLIKTPGVIDTHSSGVSIEVHQKFIQYIREKNMDLDVIESLAQEAAGSLIRTLNAQLERVNNICSEECSWEKRSVALKLSQKLQKHKRNKRWKNKRKKFKAEMISKHRDLFDKADQEVDEWRAREIANDIAKRKAEKMKAIAKLKAKEEKRKLESELELLLVVEKLQELRSIRIQKLKKQGHFFPEEDDKFLERVRESAEEEDRQAAAAAETNAAKDAIAAAEESWKSTDNQNWQAVHVDQKAKLISVPQESQQPTVGEDERNPKIIASDSEKHNLPLEFYHYYHGSNNDLGTLIEVRRGWDAYIKPGGSRIPGHWVRSPPPSDEIWASYLKNNANL